MGRRAKARGCYGTRDDVLSLSEQAYTAAQVIVLNRPSLAVFMRMLSWGCAGPELVE